MSIIALRVANAPDHQNTRKKEETYMQAIEIVTS